jgi:accessory gene regulator protein AgrB
MAAVSTLECVSVIVATLGFDIALINILGFLTFVFATYIFKDLVLSSTIDLILEYR